MKIVFIRHSNSEIDKGKHNPLWRLSEKGIARAKEAARHPLVQDIEVMYTSHQLKALHTGLLIAAEIGVPLYQEPELNELTSSCDYWQDDFEGFVRDIYAGTIERWEDGESLIEATDRFTKAVEAIAAKESDHPVVGITAHGHVLSLFATEYEDRSAYEIHNSISMPDIAVFDWESKTFEVPFGNYE